MNSQTLVGTLSGNTMAAVGFAVPIRKYIRFGFWYFKAMLFAAPSSVTPFVPMINSRGPTVACAASKESGLIQIEAINEDTGPKPRFAWLTVDASGPVFPGCVVFDEKSSALLLLATPEVAEP